MDTKDYDVLFHKVEEIKEHSDGQTIHKRE